MPYRPFAPAAQTNGRSGYVLAFTPAEWRRLLEDRDFLADPDNSYSLPRRLMGLPVRIIPDHGETSCAILSRRSTDDR